MKEIRITMLLMLAALGAGAQDTILNKQLDTRRDNTKVIKEELRVDTVKVIEKNVPTPQPGQQNGPGTANEDCVIRLEEIDYTKEPEE